MGRAVDRYLAGDFGGGRRGRLREAGPWIEGGLPYGGQVGAVGVAGRFPVAAAALPGCGGQGGPVVVSRVRGQGGWGAFGAKGRIGPAQGAPDPVSLGAANGPAACPALPRSSSLVASSSGNGSRSSARTRDCAWRSSFVNLAWARMRRTAGSTSRAWQRLSAPQSAPGASSASTITRPFAPSCPDEEVGVRGKAGPEEPFGHEVGIEHPVQAPRRTRSFSRLSTSAATSRAGPGGGAASRGPDWVPMVSRSFLAASGSSAAAMSGYRESRLDGFLG